MLFASSARMGYPLRFMGTGVAQEIDGVIIPARCTVEVTVRTLNQQFLLRPDEETNTLLLGCFGRAYDRYRALNPHVLQSLSDHIQFLATPESPQVLSDFMRDFLSTLSKGVNGHRGREGKFWQRRYRSIPAVDEATIDDRFRYILTQGTKENLVRSARDWPGVHCIDALLGGPPLVGRWRDRMAEYELRRQRERKRARAEARGERVAAVNPRIDEVWIEYPIELVPPPHWQSLRPGQRRARVAAMLRADDHATAERHRRDGTAPLGVSRILAVSPFDRPAEPKSSPAPLCHAPTKAARSAFRVVYRRFVECVRAASAKLGALVAKVGLPVGATTPPLPRCADRQSHNAVREPTLSLEAWSAMHGHEPTGPPGTDPVRA